MGNNWIILTFILVMLAIIIPAAMRQARARDPERARARQQRQRQVLEQLDRVLAPLLARGEGSQELRIGPGTDHHVAFMEVRREIQREFGSAAGVRFDREIGYELMRPGSLVAGNPEIAAQAASARRVLLQEIGE